MDELINNLLVKYPNLGSQDLIHLYSIYLGDNPQYKYNTTYTTDGVDEFYQCFNNYIDIKQNLLNVEERLKSLMDNVDILDRQYTYEVKLDDVLSKSRKECEISLSKESENSIFSTFKREKYYDFVIRILYWSEPALGGGDFLESKTGAELIEYTFNWKNLHVKTDTSKVEGETEEQEWEVDLRKFVNLINLKHGI